MSWFDENAPAQKDWFSQNAPSTGGDVPVFEPQMVAPEGEAPGFLEKVNAVLHAPSPPWMQPFEKWAATPLLHPVDLEERKRILGYDPGPDPEEYFPEDSKAREVVGGLREGVGGFVEGLSSPAMIAITAATGGSGVAGRIAAGGFAAQMASETPELWQQFNEAETLQDKTRIATTAVATIAGTGLGVRHALKPGIKIPSRAGLPPEGPVQAPGGPYIAPEARLGYRGPGTITEDVRRALERRFTTGEGAGQWVMGPDGRPVPVVPTPPEAPPQFMPAPSVEDILSATQPRVSPETGFTHFPGPEAPPEIPMPSETARWHQAVQAEMQPALAQEYLFKKNGQEVPEGVSQAVKAGKEKLKKGYQTPPVMPQPEVPINAIQEPVTTGVGIRGNGSRVGTQAPLRQPGEAAPEVAPQGGDWRYAGPQPGVAAPPAAGQPPPVQKPSKIGQSIEAKAVEAKLTQGFPETAGYDPIKIKDQAQRASDLVEKDPARAGAIIRGEEPLPAEIRGPAFITAMEEELLKNPSAQGAYELANSKLVSLTSEAAQDLRMMAERVPDSLTAKFAEIKKARAEGAESRGETPAKIKKDISKEVVKAASKRQTWSEFVREIAC